jgi:hypothetical protein
MEKNNLPFIQVLKKLQNFVFSYTVDWKTIDQIRGPNFGPPYPDLSTFSL